MSIRTILIGVLAIVFGLVAVLGIRLTRPEPVKITVDTVPVVVATVDIPRFTLLTEGVIRISNVPRELAPPDAITKEEDALGRGTVMFIGEGEVILTNKLSAKGIRGLAAAIPNGMRAVTIRTGDVTTPVGGFTLPGSKVDVLLTMRGTGYNDPSGGTTITLLQRVEVLAVDQRVETPVSQKMDLEKLRSVTLLVTPDQATKLQLGQTIGVLHLSLRNPLDMTLAEDSTIQLKDLRLPGAAAPDVPPLPPSNTPPKEKDAKDVKDTPVTVSKPPPPPAPPPIRSVRGSRSSWTRVQTPK